MLTTCRGEGGTKERDLLEERGEAREGIGASDFGGIANLDLISTYVRVCTVSKQAMHATPLGHSSFQHFSQGGARGSCWLAPVAAVVAAVLRLFSLCY